MERVGSTRGSMFRTPYTSDEGRESNVIRFGICSILYVVIKWIVCASAIYKDI